MITLREDQIEAVYKIRNGNIICGDTGSGKSLVSLAYYYLQCGGKITQGQMRDVLRDPMNLVIITTAKKRDTGDWNREMRAINMSAFPEGNIYHNKVVVDSWNNIGKYIATQGAFFIFDEQRVVGTGAWVKSFYKIAAKNQWILLSATPGDRWEDYAPVFIANGFYRNVTAFRGEHLIYDYHVDFPRVIGYLGEKKLERFRSQVLVNIDYVPNTVQHHEVIIVPYNRDLYREVMRTRKTPYKTVNIFGEVIQKPIDNASEFCATLRRVINSSPERMDKINELCSKMDRVIIFYNFDFELEALRKNNWGDKILAECNGHRHDPCPTCEKWVYLVQYNAGNEAWECMTTNQMIFYSENYSYRIMKQASGRINRSVTPYVDLYYYHIRTMSSIDVQINRALTNKKKFNESAFYKKAQKGEKRNE